MLPSAVCNILYSVSCSSVTTFVEFIDCFLFFILYRFYHTMDKFFFLSLFTIDSLNRSMEDFIRNYRLISSCNALDALWIDGISCKSQSFCVIDFFFFFFRMFIETQKQFEQIKKKSVFSNTEWKKLMLRTRICMVRRI